MLYVRSIRDDVEVGEYTYIIHLFDIDGYYFG